VNVYVEYFLLVFLCFIGALQLAASINKLSKFSFFKRPLSGYIFAFIAIFGAFCWFFISKNRCVQGVEGVEAFLSLIGAALLSFIATASISSVIHRKSEPPVREQGAQEEIGLDALRTMTYFQAVGRHRRGRKQR
jgi:hypothetical protein